MIVENKRGVRLLELIETGDENVPWSSYHPP